MAMFARSKLLGLGLALATVAAAAVYGLSNFFFASPRFQWDGLSIDPNAPIARGQVYELTLWETELPIPKNPGGYKEALEGALAEFADRYPNVRVSVEFILERDMPARLREAGQRGNPPDVAAMAEPAGGLPLQVPVDAYLPEANRTSSDDGPEDPFFPGALHPWTLDGHIWAFPRWIYWETWVAHLGRLHAYGIDAEGLVRYGWTWSDVLGIAARIRERGGRGGMALDIAHPTLFMQLLANAGAPWWASTAGPGWERSHLEEVARFLLQLREAGVITRRPEDRVFNRAVRFANEGDLFAGPVNPWLFRAMQDRLSEEALLIPVPHQDNAREAPWLVPSGYAVFRQDPYRGDDHLRAAMELAWFLSRRLGLWAAQRTGMLPTRPSDAHAWNDRTPLHHQARQFLLDYVAHYPGEGEQASLRAFLPPPETRKELEGLVATLARSARIDANRWAEEAAGRLGLTSDTEGHSINRGNGGAPR